MFGTVGEDWVDIAASYDKKRIFSRHDKVVWGWGNNEAGHIGQYTYNGGSSPLSISFAIKEIDVYSQIIKDKATGLLYSWGNNSYGELGVYRSLYQSVPVSVSVAGSFIMAGAGGYTHAALRSDGVVFTCGNETELGDNSLFSRSIMASISATAYSKIAGAVAHWTAIKAADGLMYSWGSNSSGQLGDNSVLRKNVPVSVSSADSFVDVDGGCYHTLAIRGSDGLLFAWGMNSNGQLGDNSITNRSVPRSVSSADSFVKVACGYYHSLAIKGSNGLLYAWGYNDYGQLGDNSTTPRSVPVSVSSADSFVAIAAGWGYSLAIRSDGLLFAWGSNSSGQLGNNSITNASVPVSVSSADSFKAIACSITGSSHAIRGSDGRLFSWGNNSYGQLGDNSLTGKSAPVSVWSAESCTHIAARGTVLGEPSVIAVCGSDGHLIAWGTEDSGRLGIGTTYSYSAPVSLSSAESWEKVAVGANSTYAIKGSNKLLYAWGLNSSGQLGDNNFAVSKSYPYSATCDYSFSKIACGASNFFIGINGANGLLYAWGYNTYGQLGNNSTAWTNSVTSVSSSDSFVDVACGDDFVLAIRGSDGRLFSWGYNFAGQLGDNSRTNRSVPGSVSSADSFVGVTCGGGCGYALRSDGLIYAWGYNDSGQLGDNSTTSRSVPVSVSFADSCKMISALGIACIAIKGSNGLLYSWGSNTYGQLGDNSRTNRSVPVSVSSADSWKSVYGGGTFVLAIKGSNGLLYAWGANEYGQLGDNSITSRSVPVSVSSAESFASAWTTTYYADPPQPGHSFAIKGSNGLLYAWGANAYGQLGLGNSLASMSVPFSVSSADSWSLVRGVTNSSFAVRGSDGKVFSWGAGPSLGINIDTKASRAFPVSVSVAASWKEIAAYNTHVVAIRDSDGLLYAWGVNTYGQLGDNTRGNSGFPVSVSIAGSFKAVAVGANHSVAIKGSNGLLYAWGNNSHGQLGDNSVTSRSVPVSVSSADSFIAVACGDTFTIALRYDWKIYAWGNNIYGQLGDGTRVSRSVPVSVSSPLIFTKIVAGANSSHAIDVNKGIWCWGNNQNKELGLNTMAGSFSYPVFIADSYAVIASSFGFRCAINSSGLVYAWGDNTSGQVGNNSNMLEVSPVSVSIAGSFVDINCFCAAPTGQCVVIRSDGLIYAWGYNDSGQLGDNSTTSRSVPVSVSSADSFKTVACGSKFNVAIKGSNGLLYAWGYNASGQLGDNSTTNRSVPVSVSSADSFKAIACGLNFAVAIRGSDGLLYAWGSNTYGSLGDNSRTNRSVPRSVSSAGSFVAVACGDRYIVAVRGDGLLYAWGSNSSGQLGNNNLTSYSVPQSVSSADSFTAIHCGGAHSLALRSDGLLFAWGSNSSGQLGTGDLWSYSVPQSVSSADSFIAIAKGTSAYSSYAIRSDNKIFGWGADTYPLGYDHVIKLVPTIMCKMPG